MELLSVAAIVVSIIAILRANDLSMRVLSLEKKIKEGNPKTESITKLEIVDGAEDLQSSSSPENVEVATPLQKEEDSAFILWLKEDWLLKLGGVLVIMGVLFFLSVAYTNVGPQGKVVIGYIFGMTLMVFGFWYAKRQIVGGAAIHVIGAIVVIITTYLARLPGYNLFDPVLATLLMFLTSVCVSLTAYRYDRASLAYASLLMASVVPLLTNSDRGDFFTILVYLTVVVLSVLWLAFVTRWRTLVFLSLGVLCAYSVSYVAGGAVLSHGEASMVVGLGVLFFITSLLSILRSNGATGKEDGYVALLNVIYSLVWVYDQVKEENVSIVLAVIALVYAFGFFLVYKVTNVFTSFIIYGGAALGLLGAAITIELSGRAEIIALLLLASGATVATWFLSNNSPVTKLIAFVNVVPLIYVITTIGAISRLINRSQGIDAAWKDISVLLIATVIYYSLYGYFKNKIPELSIVALCGGIVLSIVSIWQVLHIVMSHGLATFISILIYTLIGLIVLFNGVQDGKPDTIKLAKLWLGLVAARVIFYDAWQLGDITLGVLICIVIGVLLLSSTFILKKVTNVS